MACDTCLKHKMYLLRLGIKEKQINETSEFFGFGPNIGVAEKKFDLFIVF